MELILLGYRNTSDCLELRNLQEEEERKGAWFGGIYS